MTADPPNLRLRDGGEISSDQKVSFLSSPAAYPGSVREVEVKETNMSWVFLAGMRAYKLKKPVKHPFLDFSTLSAREADCREENRLNRRLASDEYLGVIPLTLEADGRLALSGKGEAVDWLVMMRRLPAGWMLDNAIAKGTVTRGQICGVADVLANFYQGLVPADVSPEDYIGQFGREQEKNCSLLTDERFGLPETPLSTVLSQVDAVLTDEPDLLMTRARDGHVIDGHGDLRPEHVCLSEPPVFIDCLEFNRAFRLIDPFDELSYLGLESNRMGAPWIGGILISRCAERLGDRPSGRLLAFYTAYRACLRARLSLAHLLVPNVREPEKWVPLAGTYLAIAERSCLTFRPQAARLASRLRDTGE